MPYWDVHFKPGFNLVRLVTKRHVDVTNEVNNSVNVTLQKQVEDIVGKLILANADGTQLPLIETLKSELGIKTPVRVATKTVACPPLPKVIPGIAAADAFDANDCFGTIFRIKVPKSGILYAATYWDFDDESTQLDLEVFKENFTQTASDAAWAPSDEDLLNFVTEIQFYAGDDHINSYTFEAKNIGKAYVAPEGYFWIQAVDRSTKTIAASAMPRVQLFILSDDPDFEP